MTITVYALAIDTFAPMLNTLSALLDKGAAHARAKGTDPSTLAGARLAPDMFPLSTQVQLACHHAKDGAARLTGEAPPKIEIKELTLDELKGLIGKTIEHLKSMSANAFEGAEDRKIEIPLQGTLVFESNGFQLLRDWSIPHFYYVLRNNGVEIGKRDYMDHIGPHIRQGSEV